ncbi:MAG: AAA family ATPase [Spirochaeta sp.]|jgi:putative ATPase|nr:AAA family ATPase [Spirochaeta sp.]
MRRTCSIPEPVDLQFENERLPLAARLRPRTLDEFFGQEQIVGPGRLLRRAIQADQLSSLILSGPPGTGKTTLARIIAARTRSQFLTVNAVLSGVKDIRAGIAKAQQYRRETNRRTILFVDEVHRWNKSQQDALLPWVEDGLFVLIGATTENPFFEVNRALLSRSRVFILRSLEENDLAQILEYALRDTERGYGPYRIEITPEARAHLIQTAAGDARTLLNALELAVETSGSAFPPPDDETITVDLAVAEDSIQQRAVLYDKDGDYHFDTISAFIKSVRGSDPDASLYWLARMVEAGEDPHYIFRRLLVQASEDIGLADPGALSVVLSCAQAFDRVGMPEGRFHLAQATLYLATTEKSNSTLGLFDAINAVHSSADGEVPTHLRDANRDGADLGHGSGYLYPHAYTEHWVAQRYLPRDLRDKVYYQQGTLGWEGERNETVRERRLLQLAVQDEEERTVWSVAPAAASASQWVRRADGAAQEQETLRDRILTGLEFRSTDRVLLHGDAVREFLWPIMRRIDAGLLAIWTDPLSRSAVEHSLRGRRSGVDAPEVCDRNSVDPAAYQGPFDRIIHRNILPEAPDEVIRRLLPRAEDGGILRVVELNAAEGDRPSRFLPGLSDPVREQLDRVEQSVYPPRPPLWREMSPTHDELHMSKPEITEVAITMLRRLDAETTRSWVGPHTPLGAALAETLTAEDIATVRAAAESVAAGEYPWQRSFTVVTFTRDRS